MIKTSIYYARLSGKPKIGKRFIRRQGRDARGDFINPSDNADAFFVIE